MKIPTIRFVFARKGLSAKSGKGSVEMVITCDRQRKFISTGVSCYPYNWKGDNKKNVYISGTGADVELNQILLSMYQKAYKIISGMVESGNVDISAIPTLLKAQNVDMTFLDYIMSRMDRQNVQEVTYRQKISFYNKLSEYGKIKFFSDINEKSIRDFDEWLHRYEWTVTDQYGNEVTKKYSQATIGSFHKNLKAFVAEAVVDGYLKENVYVIKRIKVDKGTSRIDQYLTDKEIRRVLKAKMPTKSLSEARDLFSMQIFTGMAYIDLMEYDFKKLKETEVGSVCHGVRRKTGVEFVFVLTKDAKKILEKYKYVLPKMSNQKYNTKLKIVADASGIDRAITSHDGRRSCGFMLLNAGVPIEIVSRVLGHSSIRQTQEAYARILDETVAKELNKVL